MYLPKHFTNAEPHSLQALIESYNFAILFSGHDETSQATHLPFLYDPERGPHGTLIGHMARANPQWREFDGALQVLVVFQGAHAYITPSWYADPVAVPTWNYAAVHAYGRPTLVDRPDELRAIVERLAGQEQARLGDPWEVSQAEPIMVDKLRGIMGFEIPIDRLEGKYKLSQNRSREDQQGVVRALANGNSPMGHEVAGLMQANLEQDD